MNLWTQLFYLPLTAFVCGLDFMVRTLQAVQQTAQQIAIATPNAGLPQFVSCGFDRSTSTGGAPPGNVTTFKETGAMSQNCNCGDQCGKPFCEVRVYEYYIMSVKPCDERMLYGPTSTVVTSDMSGEGFTSYAIALYCQDHRVPREDLKYLRVCYRINCTFPKEQESCSTHARDQVAVLREIRDALAAKSQAASTPSATSAPPPPERPGKGGAAAAAA
jgi:hypothetical protein